MSDQSTAIEQFAEVENLFSEFMYAFNFSQECAESYEQACDVLIEMEQMVEQIDNHPHRDFVEVLNHKYIAQHYTHLPTPERLLWAAKNDIEYFKERGDWG